MPVTALPRRSSASAARTSSRDRSAAGAPWKPLVAYAAVIAAALALGCYRRIDRVAAHAHVLQVDQHRRPRQRAAVEGRSDGGAERAARREPRLDRPRRAGAGGCWRRRGSATRRCADRCRRRSTSIDLRAPADRHRPHQQRHASRRRSRRDHRSVRTRSTPISICRSSTACRRVAERQRDDDRRGACRSGGARDRGDPKSKPAIARRLSQVDVTDAHNAIGHPQRRSRR